jgi:manganese/iron transport system ATP-binding protein
MTIFRELRKTSDHIRKSHPAHDAQSPSILVKDLNLRYESGTVLDNLSFSVNRGERLAVVGPNGAGKSTLFKIIAGVLNPTSGTVEVYGQEAGGHICIAYVPQRSLVDWSFPVTVEDVVMMGRTGQLGLFHQPGKTDREKVRQALNVVHLTDIARRQISQLSGGQQQRMFVARALAQEAELMLMDEPFSGLDINSQDDLFEILDTLQDRGVTVVVALHDLKMAAERFDRVMLLNRRIVSLGSPEDVIQADHLMEAYEGRLRIIKSGSETVALDDTCCEEGGHQHG